MTGLERQIRRPAVSCSSSGKIVFLFKSSFIAPQHRQVRAVNIVELHCIPVQTAVTLEPDYG